MNDYRFIDDQFNKDVDEASVESEKEKNKVIYKLEYTLMDEKGLEIEKDSASAWFDVEELQLLRQANPPIRVAYSDLRRVEDHDWFVAATQADMSQIIFRKLGRQYDSFWSEMNERFRKAVKKDLLVEEKQLAFFDSALFEYVEGDYVYKIQGGVYLQETGLVFAPETGDMERVPYVFIDQVISDAETWRILLVMKNGRKYIIGKLGRETDRFYKELLRAINDQKNRSLEFVKNLVPSLSQQKLRSLSGKFLDGLAVPRNDLTAVPELWLALEKKMEEVGLKDTWTYLCTIADTDMMRIGIKTGLFGSGQKDYVWFFALVWRNGKGTLVMEAAAGEFGGRATYLFNVPDHIEKEQHLDMQKAIGEQLMDEINYCLYMVNFRREPIYLSDQQLQNPKYLHYRHAVERVSGLVRLRELYRGRVIHRNIEQWINDLIKKLPNSIPKA